MTIPYSARAIEIPTPSVVIGPDGYRIEAVCHRPQS